MGLAGVCFLQGHPQLHSPGPGGPLPLACTSLPFPKACDFFRLLAGGPGISVSCLVKLAVGVGGTQDLLRAGGGRTMASLWEPPKLKHHLLN